MSQSRIARIARSTANFSTPQSTFAFFLIPAVSTRMNSSPSYFTLEFILSLVVPEISLTITLSSPRSALTMEDLPALGFPTIASLISSESVSSSSAEKSAVIASRRSPTPPEPCNAEMG